jgi:anti-sigma regulatory factor (Ser/Thr protein kinase)
MTALAMLDNSQVGEARRHALRLAEVARFDPEQTSRVGIVATEAASNLVKHAKQGELLLRVIEDERNPGVEIIAVDRGPGMFNVQRCLEDGFSTAGSSGTGLGAARRIADVFDVYSLPGRGTALLARLFRTPPAPAQAAEVGTAIAPLTGETVSGDGCAFHLTPQRSTFLMVDGLGHGPHAAEATREAIQIFQQAPQRAPKLALEAIHDALRKTRGAAVAIAAVNRETQQLLYSSVGNISTMVVRAGAGKMLASTNGIVGHAMRRADELVLPWTGEGTLVMFSDGLRSQLQLELYPGLFVRPPALIAGMLYGQYKRGRDDASVLVATVGGAAA